MQLKSNQPKASAEQVVKDIRRAIRHHYSTEDKILIVLSGQRGEDSIAELCHKKGIAQGLYYSWSKEFLEAGKKRLAGDTTRAATSDEVLSMRSQTQALKEAVADLTWEFTDPGWHRPTICCRPIRGRVTKNSFAVSGGENLRWTTP
jgi:transposase